MKSIVIIEQESSQYESIEKLLETGQNDFEIVSLTENMASPAVLKKNIGDLIVYDLSSFTDSPVDHLVRITSTYPYVPYLAILNEDGDFLEQAKKMGVSNCLVRPLESDTLETKVKEALDAGSKGQIKGIPIHSLLQMFEGEEKTCTLRIRHGEEVGFIFIDNGVVISAETLDQQGEDAIYSIITWEDAEVEILSYNSMRPREITKPLISLIMEGFRLKDERDSLEEKQKTMQKPALDLKHFSTAGSRISLDLGAKIKLEFEGIGTPLISTMVGMLPEEYLIATSPTPHTIVTQSYEAGETILVQYLHLGRLCMFRTQIIKIIDEPHQLLFLEYPSVVHYHELRRAKRTTIFIPCTIDFTGDTEFYGVLVDLSGLGCLCQIKAKGNPKLPNLEIESRVQLKCLLPGLKEDQELQGIVKNFKRTGSETRIGIEFYHLEQYIRDSIERYVYSVESISN